MRIEVEADSTVLVMRSPMLIGVMIALRSNEATGTGTPERPAASRDSALGVQRTR
jgi:hypothetical protein